MKIGIFGGTFDPVHLGHLLTVEEAARLLDLVRVFLIPSASPPHKPGWEVTTFRHRLEMTKLAASDNDLLEVLDIEGRRSGPSYSVDTLDLLRRKMGPEVEFHFLLGMDAFLDITSWHDYRRLFEFAHFAVINRGDRRENDFKDMARHLEAKEIKSPDGDSCFTAGGMTIRRLQTRMIEISSTEIRQLVKAGRSIRYLVTEPVRLYIVKEGLYLDGAGA